MWMQFVVVADPNFQRTRTSFNIRYCLFYNFSKIKKKKGDIIAIVESTTFFEISGIGSTWETTAEFSQIGEFDGKLTFNVTKGYIMKNRMDGALIMKGKDLGDDSSWNASIEIALKQKIPIIDF